MPSNIEGSAVKRLFNFYSYKLSGIPRTYRTNSSTFRTKLFGQNGIIIIIIIIKLKIYKKFQ
jgi:hypothetical protein